MGVGDEHLVGPEDDDFHPCPDDDWWWHETCWYWFFVPERKLGGWLYNYVRPSIGVAGGGCWVWDERSYSILDAPYYANYSNLRLPDERDLRNFRFPSGTRVEMLEPLKRYRLRHEDRDWIQLDLEFDAIMAPWVSAETGSHPPRERRAHHFDQVGRVTGELVLSGEALAVDCLAIRDRTWARRPERWRTEPVGYTNAAASADTAFLFAGWDALRRGYLVLDGVRADLAAGTRRLERDPEHGYMTRIFVEASDTQGRRLEAQGESLSRMAMKIPGVHGVVWTSLVRWTINGIEAWGEDQDAWPIQSWLMFRRERDR
ncbi:MAG: hypothetical protein VX681_15510 [Myxococcota bacterium]|nr:hypothetical protein [Myxococcota bacterium]